MCTLHLKTLIDSKPLGKSPLPKAPEHSVRPCLFRGWWSCFLLFVGERKLAPKSFDATGHLTIGLGKEQTDSARFSFPAVTAPPPPAPKPTKKGRKNYKLKWVLPPPSPNRSLESKSERVLFSST